MNRCYERGASSYLENTQAYTQEMMMGLMAQFFGSVHLAQLTKKRHLFFALQLVVHVKSCLVAEEADSQRTVSEPLATSLKACKVSKEMEIKDTR